MSNIENLCSLGKYIHQELVIKDVISATSTYKNLVTKLDTYIYKNGYEEKLIALDGTIPIRFRGNYYHIPICIYLRKDHPNSPPICYVRPTSTMTIKESKNVDSEGKTSFPLLQNWKSSNELLTLLQVMIIIFSETPPVYQKPKFNTENPYSNLQNSLNFSESQKYLSANSSYTNDASTTSPSTSNSNTISEAHIRASLISAASDRLRDRIKEKIEQFIAEIDVLKKTGDDLQNGSKQLDQIITKMQSDITSLEETKKKMDIKDRELTELLAKHEEFQDKVNIDDAYGPIEPLYKQLLNTFAEENSIADAIYYLSEALKRKVIDLEVFLKHVRELSTRQFMLRALMQKCREKAGLFN